MRDAKVLADALSALQGKYGSGATPPGRTVPECADILRALGEFQECVRYLNTRRSKGAVLALQSEADVQDALYLMLRPWITDLIAENPTDRTANRYAIKDFLIPSARTVVEAKFIRDKDHGRSVSKEIHDDIEIYRRHPLCSNIIFFLYDPDSLIPDQRALIASIEEERSYGGTRLRCFGIVKP